VFCSSLDVALTQEPGTTKAEVEHDLMVDPLHNALPTTCARRRATVRFIGLLAAMACSRWSLDFLPRPKTASKQFPDGSGTVCTKDDVTGSVLSHEAK
jgi:hypothetical protein